MKERLKKERLKEESRQRCSRDGEPDQRGAAGMGGWRMEGWMGSKAEGTLSVCSVRCMSQSDNGWPN